MVKRPKSTSLSVPAELAARAGSFALAHAVRLPHASSVSSRMATRTRRTEEDPAEERADHRPVSRTRASPERFGSEPVRATSSRSICA